MINIRSGRCVKNLVKIIIPPVEDINSGILVGEQLMLVVEGA